MDMFPITTIGSRLETLALRAPFEPSCLKGVRLYFFSLADCAAREAELLGLLSRDEQEQAAGIRHDARRSAFIASRAMLREALSDFTAKTIGRSEWAFEADFYGKPRLVAPPGFDLKFSLSYTGNLLVIAVSKKFELGVDVESVAAAAEGELPWQVLNAAERRYLHSLPAGEQNLEFLRLWTLKEAYTKYVGLGASLDFRGVEISLDPIEATAPARTGSHLEEPILHQQVLTIDGEQIVLALAGGRAN
jgi:4'-phosphopantetheinyl transferase